VRIVITLSTAEQAALVAPLRQLASVKPHGRAGPNEIIKARLLAEAAKEVSQPGNLKGYSEKQRRRGLL